MTVLLYGYKAMLWKEERSGIRDMQMDILRDLLEIRRTDTVRNAWIRELCDVKKVLDERIDGSVLRRIGHIEKREC